MERESTGRPAPDFLPKSVDPPKEFEADYARKREAIETALTRFETPFYLYDEVGIRSTAARLRTLFGWAPEYREYYAVKALPNPEVLRILNEEGCGADASSGPELLLAKAVGIEGEAVMFTSNNTDPREFRQAADDGAIINFDDLTQLEAYRREVGPYPDLVCLRFQPDPEAFEGNEIIGTTAPKFGMSADQIGEGIHHLKRRGVKRFGLHTMPVSNELSAAKLGEASRLFERALQADPLAESITRRLMALHLAQGERAEALRAWQHCRAMLILHGAAPAADTLALARRAGFAIP